MNFTSTSTQNDYLKATIKPFLINKRINLTSIISTMKNCEKTNSKKKIENNLYIAQIHKLNLASINMV